MIQYFDDNETDNLVLLLVYSSSEISHDKPRISSHAGFCLVFSNIS